MIRSIIYKAIMEIQQIIIFSTLLATLALFIWGKWRYDFIALMALMTVVLSGIIPAKDAFLGFGHPAVITVAAVLILSQGLQNAGLVDFLTRHITRVGESLFLQLTALNIFIATISAFMNNVGALAIVMPVVIQMARKHKRSPSLMLIPVAFSSLLGGMTTEIGTPPNIIVASMRAKTGLGPFTMFDFTPVGLGVALGGIAFLSLIAWRLLPERKGQLSPEELFEIEAYITEVKAGKEANIHGKTLREVENSTEGNVLFLGIIRGKRKLTTLSPNDRVKENDILIIEADSDSLEQFLEQTACKLIEDKKITQEMMGEKNTKMSEAVIGTSSSLIGKTVGSLRLRWRYGVSFLAVARQGQRLKKRIANISLKAGDILLIRGPETNVQEAITTLGCFPLADRKLRIGEPKRLFLASSLFIIAICFAALGLLPIQISFVIAVIAMYVTGLIRIKEFYQAVDWPIIILLGAMIPVGKAMEVSGSAQLLAQTILSIAGKTEPLFILGILLIATMFLSDLVNNATAAILMVPIAIRLATDLALLADPFLMAVAIGASCPFLTPIGHQCNALVLGPGGYRFSDYWRIGLPLEIIITAISIPLIYLFWPFTSVVS